MPVTNTPITKSELLKELRIASHDSLTVNLSKDASEFNLVITSSQEGAWPTYAATYDFAGRFPQRRETGLRSGTQWTVPATDISAQLITELWPADRVSMSPDALTVIQYLLATVQHQALAMRRTAEYREYLSYREIVQKFAVPYPQFIKRSHQSHEGLKMMLHQDVGLQNCLHTDGYGLFMEQGTGKTPVVIKRVDLEAPVICQMKGRMYRVIIVAPKNVRQNWAVEFERFSDVPGKVTVLRGGEFKRAKQFMEAMVRFGDDSLQYTVVVLSYEALSGKTWEMLNKIEWDLAVLDEGHYIKGQSKRAKAAMLLRDVSLARMVLTGTPICNSVFDLYNLFEFMREGGSGFTSRDAFCKFYGVFEARDPARGTRRLSSVQNLPFMKERLARMTFIVKKSEALPDLPEKVYDIYEVEMTLEQEEVYNRVRDELTAEIEDDLSDETKMINADNILVKLLRLAQITSGFISFDPIIDEATGEVLSARQIDRFDPNPKLEALIELLKEKEPEQKTLVWAHFKMDIQSIMARLKIEGVDAVEFRGGTHEADREENVSRFNGDPRCKVLVGNPGAGGTGVNLLGYDWWNEQPKLETNCDHEIYYSQDWSHPKRSQSEDRPHRKGTRVSIRITDLTVLGTVDEEIRARVTDKRTSALKVQDLREVLKRVLGK